MTQSSLFWPTGATGDGASQYTDAQLFAWLRRTFVGSVASEGVHAGYANALAVTGVASPLSIDTGAGIVDGVPYENTAAVNLIVPTPTVGTTGHRVVLRANWAAQTVRVALVSSTDGVAAIPAATQTPGTTYDITLATLTITTGGVITVTDARSYLHYLTRVNTAMIDANAVTLDKIPDRTRKVLVQSTTGWDTTGATALRSTIQGIYMGDADATEVYGRFRIPTDLVSLTSIKAVVMSDANGNGYFRHWIDYATVGQAYNAHTDVVGYAAVALTTTLMSEVQPLTVASWVAGDYLLLMFQRDSTNIADTIAGGVYMVGWLIEYVADT